jgi:hypothetical protein
MSVKTIFLPPVAPKKGERYDLHQFSKPPKLITKTSGIDASEIGIRYGKPRGYGVVSKGISEKTTPPWANSDEKIKLVVTHMLWRMVHMSGVRFPQERFETEPLVLALELEEQLKKRCIDFFQVRNQIAQSTIIGQKRAKKYGFALLLSGVIYQRYRLNRKSNEISAEFKGLVTPVSVRQLLSRANLVARIIFPPEDSLPIRKDSNGRMARDLAWKRVGYERGDTARRTGRGRKLLPSPEECFRLVQSGRTAMDISAEYECNLNAMESKIRLGRHIVLEGKSGKVGRSKLSIPQILQLHKEGLSIEEITQTSGRALAFVHCVLTEHGLLKAPVPVACDITMVSD